jgi:acyl carrier protein
LVDNAVACGFPLIEDHNPEVDSYVPLGCERLVTRGPLPAKIYSHVRSRARKKKSKQLLTFDVVLLDEQGEVVVEITGFTFKKIVAADLAPVTVQRDVSSDLDSAGTGLPGNSLADAVRLGIAPEEGIEALQRILLDGRHAQVVVSPSYLLSQFDDRQDSRVPETAVESEDTSAVELAESMAVATGDDVEQAVIEVLKKALGVNHLAPDEDFFEIGGDSLSAMRVVTQLKHRFSTSLPIGTLFENPTAAELTAVVRERLDAGHAG